MDSNGTPGTGEGGGSIVAVPVMVSVVVETYVVVVETDWVDVTCVETVDVATVLVTVTDWVEVAVEVTVTGTVVTLVTAVGPKRRTLPTAQPSVDDNIHTALIALNMPVIGCAKTCVQVKPFQYRMTGSVPEIAPTAHPSIPEIM